MTRSQRWLLVVAGIVAALLFLVLTFYFGEAAAGHPRVKHMLLFIVLAGASALVAWFSFPAGMVEGRRGR